MLNKYPLWKNLLVVVILALGALYGAPNLYGEDPALQITGVRGAGTDNAALERVNNALSTAQITPKNINLEANGILVRFDSTDSQLKAKEVIAEAMGDKYVTALNMAPATPQWLIALGAGPMKKGLDLSGGIHFTMEVDMKDAINKALDTMVQDFRSDLMEAKLRYKTVRRLGDDKVVVEMRDAADQEAALSLLKKRYNGELLLTNAGNLDFAIVASMSEAKIKETRDYALKQNITIIRSRVNELGVSEPLVQQQGAERIVVQLPGIQDSARAKEILGATATLEFRMVDDKGDVRAAVAGRVPPGSKLYYGRDGQPYLLQNRVMLTGDHIVGAQSGNDEYNRPQVNIKLDSKGGNKFEQATKSNIGKLMATVFVESKPTGKKDENGHPVFEKVEEVINAATIQARLGRSFRITGIDSAAEAHNLALLLRAGALIAPIQIVEERTVGPSLGKENIEKGYTAMAIGFGLVLAFMAFYYRAFGMVANLALGLNLVMIFGVMSMIPGATLTLPGIAGIVLTVGMAVDANVLIFERIREELRAGQSPQQAIHRGYDSAFATIADANITTFITAIILYAVGTGAIKGFAITLAIGIITSMFTAIMVTRAVVNAVWGGKRLQTLSV